MSLTKINGDAVNAFLKGEIKILAHGVNCSNGFGSGIAKAIAQAIPEVKFAYHKKYDTHGWNLTEVQEIKTSQGLILNCATQKEYGREPNKVYAELHAIRHVLNHAFRIARSTKQPIGFPLIGAGLGGLDPVDVYHLIKEIFYKDYYEADARLYIMDKAIWKKLEDLDNNIL